ncbi:MAG TPA: ACP phosphodiesterase [Candidatus Brocadiaceae bacterium]
MNYLAHLYLADNSPGSLIGGLLGDFVKGPLDNAYDDDITKGTLIHRRIDSFSDSHEKVFESKRLISPKRSRFSDIIIDVCFDHFLARSWSEYSNEELADFTRKVYVLLSKYSHILPYKLRSIIPKMIEEDWLGSYQYIEGIGQIMDRVSRRLTRGEGLLGAVKELETNYEKMEENFKSFFPELIAYVEGIRRDYA